MILETYKRYLKATGEPMAAAILTQIELTQPSKPTATMTIKEAATALRISERTIRGLIATGDLGHHRVGSGRGQIRISPKDLEDYQGRTKTTFKHLFKD